MNPINNPARFDRAGSPIDTFPTSYSVQAMREEINRRAQDATEAALRQINISNKPQPEENPPRK